MNDEQGAVYRSIHPVSLQEYLRSRGFSLKPEVSGQEFMAYERAGMVVDVPLHPEYADYPRRLSEVIDPLARAEGISVRTLVDDLTQPVGDVLAVRVVSDLTASGTIPLEHAIRIRQGTRMLLLSAAHSAISAQAFFPRLSRANAVALVASVQEGQSQRGSLISRFIVPVEPAVGQSSQQEEPYARKVVRLLLQALDGVRRVRSLGDYDSLLSMGKDGVSGNLLSALATMSPPGSKGSLEFSVAWARNRTRPTQGVFDVRFASEALVGLDAVAEAMKEQTRTPGFEVVGYVTRLDRGPSEADGPGEIVLVPRAGDTSDLARVSVQLEASSYRDAIMAHQRGDVVRVVGTLQKVGRRWALVDASGFETLSGDSAAVEDR